MNRRGERTQPCHSSTLTLKDFVFMPLTQTQTSDCLYNDLIAGIDCYLSVVEGFAFFMILRIMHLEFSTPIRATHGGKVEVEKQTKSNLTNVAK